MAEIDLTGRPAVVERGLGARKEFVSPCSKCNIALFAPVGGAAL